MFRLPAWNEAVSSDLRVWAMTLSALVPISWLLIHGQFSVLAFVFFLVALVVTALTNKNLSVCLTFTYLLLLGDIRRIVATFVGFPKLDPLLLVGPLVTLLLAVPLVFRLRMKEPISKAMIGLMTVMALEVVNPKQGPITVGLAGAMFYLVPLLWFWIGRTYGADQLLERVLYRVVIPIAVVAAALGLWETYVGFLPWQAAWIASVSSHYHALGIGGGFTRAFGFSVNSIEYSNLLLIGSTCVLAAFFAGRRAYGLLFPLLAFALFLSSSRLSIIKLLFAMALSWAVSSKGGRGWAVRLPIALAIGFGFLALTLSQFASKGGAGANSAAGFSAQHQVEGLSHPLDSKHSTAGTHMALFTSGIEEGFTYPIGNGLGAVTLGSKLGGEEGAAQGGSDTDATTGTTEVDISDAFVSMGLVGGLLYLLIIAMIVHRAVQFGRTAPRYLGLPALGLLASMLGGWNALGQYAIGPLIWFVIGALAYNRGGSVARPVPTRTKSKDGVPVLLGG